VNDSFSLEADAGRALQLDRELRQRLAESLSYALTELDLVEPVLIPRFETFLVKLRAAPVDPQVFGIYYDLVLALENDESEAAKLLLSELLELPPPKAGIQIRSLADLSAIERDRYRRQVDTDPNSVMRIDPPPPAMNEHCSRRVGEALSLLQLGYPELHAELHAILREVVVAVSPEIDPTLEFDGASSFLLWGSIALNARGHETRLDTLEALVHESAHCLLFGLSSAERLLENDNQPRYSSPLRIDPRPLDGIFHATFVTARMHHAVTTLLRRGVLRDQEAAQAERSLTQHAAAFSDGTATLRQHAMLTSLGRTVFDGMLRSMPA
jgi:HEXXH motif-containing protein